MAELVDDAQISMNDLTVVGIDEYYFTNDSGFAHDSFWRMFELMMPLYMGSVGYCKDGKCQIVM